MRSVLVKTIVALNFFTLSASSAFAQSWGGGWGAGGSGGWSGWGSGGSGGGWGSGGRWGSGGGWSGGGHVAPEIDASSGMLAVVALTAVLLFVLERRRQTKALVPVPAKQSD